MYWIMLVALTMQRQIKHMIKYKYIPVSIGKRVSLGDGNRDGNRDGRRCGSASLGMLQGSVECWQLCLVALMLPGSS